MTSLIATSLVVFLTLLDWVPSVDGFLIPRQCPSKFVRVVSKTRTIKEKEDRSTRTTNTLFHQPLLLSSKTTTTAIAASTIPTNNEELLAGIIKIDASNTQLCEKLETLREQSFFRLYSVDILASCEYIPQELFECYSETCEIYPIEEEEVPLNIKDVDSNEYSFELDGWARWDMPTDDYYDMIQFPEDYTGYDGSDVWNFIHERICFTSKEETTSSLWKLDFNKAVSGIHSMISAQIIRGIQDRVESDNDDFSDDEQKWTDPIVEYNRRLNPTTAEISLALENLYFCYMLLLSSVSKIKSRLEYEMNDGMLKEEEAYDALKPTLSESLLDDVDIQVASKKLQDHVANDNDGLWELRLRTRELLRIMNCVQCNKCRLHGKISMMGFSTALQVLVGGPSGKGGDVSTLHRVELAALLVTLSKFARAIETCRSFAK